MSKDELKKGLTDFTKLPPELELMPRHRKEKKVAASAVGIVLMVFGLLSLAGVGYLAYVTREKPSWILLGGGGGLGFVILIWGALSADPETTWPALRGMLAFLLRVNEARKS